MNNTDNTDNRHNGSHADTMRKTDLLTENFRTLTPAYGRDYRSKAAIMQDFDAGKDFLLQPENLPINKAQIAYGVVVNIRYAQLRKVAVCTVWGENKAGRPA